MTEMGQRTGAKAVSSNILWETPKTGLLGDPKRSIISMDDLIKKCDLLLDVAATAKNKVCRYFIDEEEDGLKVNWHNKLLDSFEEDHGTLDDLPKIPGIFVNPPGYSQKLITPWVEKCHNTAFMYRVKVVALLPAYTDAPWWDSYVWNDHLMGYADIDWIPGRVKFWKDGKPQTSSPFFSSVIVRWDFT